MKKKVQNKGWYRLKYNLEYKTILLVLVTLASTFLLTNNIGGESSITGAAAGYSIQTPLVSNVSTGDTGDVNVSVFLWNLSDSGRVYNETIDANDVDATDDTNEPVAGNDVGFFKSGISFVNDVIYIGLTTQFTGAYFNVTGAADFAGSAADTWRWSYYNGSNWSNLSDVRNVTDAFVSVGVHYINWSVPSDWTNATVTNATDGTSYGPYYYVRMFCKIATDNCAGTAIAQVSLKLPAAGADTIKPSVSAINSPTNGTTYISGNTLLFNASVSDDTGITSVLFQISNGSNPGNLTGSSTNTSLYNASLTVSSTNIIDGTHTLIVFASDAAGNINGTVNLTFITDTAAPSISSSSSSSVSTTSATLSATTNEAATCKYSNTDQAYASMADTMGGGGGTSHSASATGLSSGRSYVYYIRCVDTPGNAQGSSTSVSFTTTSSGGGSSGGGGSSSSSSTAAATTTSTTTTSTTSTTTSAASTTAAPATTTETQQFIQDNLVTVEVTAITAETVAAVEGETTAAAAATATVGAATTTTTGEETGETATAAADAVQTESINPVESVVISIVNNADKPISLQPVIVSEEAGVSIPNEQVVDAFLLARISEENIDDLSEAELKNLVEQEKKLFELIEKANVQPVYTEKTASLINQFSVDEAIKVIASVNIPVPPSSIGEVVNIEVDPEKFAVEGINFVIPQAEEKAEIIPQEEVINPVIISENVEEIIDENSIVGLENVPAADKVGVVAIEALSNLPAADLFQGEQFKQLDINVNVVDMANIKFRVPEEWVNEVGIDKEDIGMYHYNELPGLWEELVTEVVGIDGGFVHLEAQARAFSYFIIGEKKPQLTENKLNKAVRKILNEGEPVQEQMMALNGIVYTGEQISGKLLESSLGACGEVIVQPGEKFESTCKLKRGISLESESFKIKFTSQGKEVFEKEVGPRKGVIGTALDVNKEEGLLEFYMLIPERVDEIKDGEEEYDNYYLEISLNKNDENLGEGVVYSDYFGPYKVKRDEGFIFAQQLVYDSQRYVGVYHIRTKVLNGDRVAAEHLFVENLGEKGVLPKRLSDDVFNEVASVVAVVLPLLSLLSFMFFRRRRVK